MRCKCGRQYMAQSTYCVNARVDNSWTGKSQHGTKQGQHGRQRADHKGPHGTMKEYIFIIRMLEGHWNVT